MTLMNQEKKKKSFIEKIQAIRQKNEKEVTAKDSADSSDLQCEFNPERTTSLSGVGSMPLDHTIQSFRTFVATWNVGGKSPNKDLSLDDVLPADDPADIYVLGFQEIVPLNAGNVLVIEDNEPAAKWLAMINQSLNKPPNMGNREWKNVSTLSGSLFFAKPSLKRISKIFRAESRRRLKACNCSATELERKNSKDFCFRCNQQSFISEDDLSTDEDDDDDSNAIDMSEISSPQRMKYSLVASRQMVGIFVCVWMRTELVQYVGHLRISCLSRGIMGCLGNKGCISVSMTFHQTSFCFVCGHLASGEKEGDELRRNLDVIETLKNTQFRKVCRSAQSRIPLKILGHDRVIWLGDLNYRIALSYSETRKLMAENERDALLNKDQLKIEREAGRVFKGWKEGKIFFAPTYKYSYNSDAYAGENMKKSKKRRTPAWCDRILWYGEGIRQAYYIRGESRFSDHRPVCAEFLIDVAVEGGGLRRGMSGPHMKIGPEELLPTMVRYGRERTM